ncbi:SDR family NAD(P)-dependent oxidoreductase [Streptomyces dysideae]|uniref:Short-chain dehydrogenase n=1 Tax=Streptomyces dysideae TaxID=909626 RepID=A0A101UTK2_9ACTN|nr:SDR family oxidoreductase [Streptomyces dysideae]KUO16530.1 short-chain dehydrogenase [Streptomyces dysideae]
MTVVLITGAASGIGAATAREAVRRGHRVAVTDIDLAGADRLAGQLGSAACAVGLDIRDEAAWETAFDTVASRLGPVEVLINNAGIIHTGYARQLSMAQHRHMVEVNLLGPMTGMMTALPRMRAQGHGHIITVCSMSSFLPLIGYTSYGATKHGLRAFHHSVAIEERGGPVTFSIIHPPGTRTPMLEQEMADPSSVITFAEKPLAPERVASVIVDAIVKKPVEVVHPALGGRVQRVAGVFPRLMRVAIPRVAAMAKRRAPGAGAAPAAVHEQDGSR